MNGCFSEEQLALYQAGDLTVQESATLGEHVLICATCREVLADLQLSSRLLAQAAAVSHPEDLHAVRSVVLTRLHRAKWRARVLQLAAVLMIGVGLSILAVLLRDTSEVASPVALATPMPPPPPARVERLPEARPAAQVQRRARGHHSNIGLRSVVLTTRDGRPQLQIATADPNVIILLK